MFRHYYIRNTFPPVFPGAWKHRIGGVGAALAAAVIACPDRPVPGDRHQSLHSHANGGGAEKEETRQREMRDVFNASFLGAAALWKTPFWVHVRNILPA